MSNETPALAFQMVGFSGQLGSGKDTVAAAVGDLLAPGRWVRISFTHALRMEVNDLYVACEREHLRPRFVFRGADGSVVSVPKIGTERPKNPDGSWFEIVASDAVGPCVEVLESGEVCGESAALEVDSYQRTPAIRLALQWHGTDLRRAEDYDYWVRKGLEAARAELESGRFDLVLFTDVRFPNEADAIMEAGGAVIRLLVTPEIRDARVLARDGHLPLAGAHEHPSETALNSYDRFSLVLSNDGPLAETVARACEFLTGAGEGLLAESA